MRCTPARPWPCQDSARQSPGTLAEKAGRLPDLCHGPRASAPGTRSSHNHLSPPDAAQSQRAPLVSGITRQLPSQHTAVSAVPAHLGPAHEAGACSPRKGGRFRAGSKRPGSLNWKSQGRAGPRVWTHPGQFSFPPSSWGHDALTSL